MKKVININFQGQVIAIEETAYEILKHYIDSLKNYFSREEGGDEIVNDIENRIAELFGNRLKLGINCITDDDVKSIVASIGRPEDFDTEYDEAVSDSGTQGKAEGFAASEGAGGSVTDNEAPRALYRNENDKIIAGVCSGLAHYFKIDPVWVRIVFVLLFGILFWVYLLLWIVLKPKQLETNVTKRLYRNPNDKLIGGVCGGIAAYFKIETWIPRVVFAVPLLLNLVGMVSLPLFPWNRLFHNVDFNWNLNLGVVVVYAVLWAIIPKAVTVKQKLEMMGEDDYIKSIRETVSDNVANVKSRSEADESPEQPTKYEASAIVDGEAGKVVLPPDPPKAYAANTASYVSAREKSGCLNAFVIMLKVLFFGLAGIFAIAFLSMLGVFLFAGASFVPLKSLFIDPGTETNMLIGALILMIAIPVISVIIWIIRRSMKLKSRPVIGVAATVLWFLGISLVGVLTSKIVNKFKVESTAEKTIEIMPFASDKLYVEMAPYGEDYYTFKSGFGPGSDIDGMPYYTINKDSLLFQNIRLQVIDSKDSLFHVRTIAATSSNDLKKAKSDIREFSYNIVQKDSVLLIPEFFQTPIDQGFRKQNVVVEISIPKGKKAEVSEQLEDYRHNRLPKIIRKKYNYSDVDDYEWDIDSVSVAQQPDSIIVKDTI